MSQLRTRAWWILMVLMIDINKGFAFAAGKKFSKLSNESESQFLSRMLNNYNKNALPNEHMVGYDSLKVEINMYVNSIASINVLDMDYSLSLFLRQRWTDLRLSFDGLNETLSLIYLRDKLWIPDLFFRNSKHAFLHDVTTPNHLIWLEPSGRLTYSQKITIKASCQMNLHYFPMDRQECFLSIGSYGFPANKLQFIWWMNKTGVEIPDLVLSEFDKPIADTGYCTKTYNMTGSFSCLYVRFQFQRKYGYYLVHTYIPSMLIVSICWVSFWIDANAVPARISLGLLSILSLLTQASSTLTQLPRVSYIKAIDVWLFTCLAFVVLSLMEFAVVNILIRVEAARKAKLEFRAAMCQDIKSMAGNIGRYIKKKNNTFQIQSEPLKESDCLSKSLSEAHSLTAAGGSSGCAPKNVPFASSDKNGMYKNELQFLTRCPRPQSLDNLFVALYPFAFMIFNLFYWSFYAIYGQEKLHNKAN